MEQMQKAATFKLSMSCTQNAKKVLKEDFRK